MNEIQSRQSRKLALQRLSYEFFENDVITTHLDQSIQGKILTPCIPSALKDNTLIEEYKVEWYTDKLEDEVKGIIKKEDIVLLDRRFMRGSMVTHLRTGQMGRVLDVTSTFQITNIKTREIKDKVEAHHIHRIMPLVEGTPIIYKDNVGTIEKVEIVYTLISDDEIISDIKNLHLENVKKIPTTYYSKPWDKNKLELSVGDVIYGKPSLLFPDNKDYADLKSIRALVVFVKPIRVNVVWSAGCWMRSTTKVPPTWLEGDQLGLIKLLFHDSNEYQVGQYVQLNSSSFRMVSRCGTYSELYVESHKSSYQKDRIKEKDRYAWLITNSSTKVHVEWLDGREEANILSVELAPRFHYPPNIFFKGDIVHDGTQNHIGVIVKSNDEQDCCQVRWLKNDLTAVPNPQSWFYSRVRSNEIQLHTRSILRIGDYVSTQKYTARGQRSIPTHWLGRISNFTEYGTAIVEWYDGSINSFYSPLELKRILTFLRIPNNYFSLALPFDPRSGNSNLGYAPLNYYLEEYKGDPSVFFINRRVEAEVLRELKIKEVTNSNLYLVMKSIFKRGPLPIGNRAGIHHPQELELLMHPAPDHTFLYFEPLPPLPLEQHLKELDEARQRFKDGSFGSFHIDNYQMRPELYRITLFGLPQTPFALGNFTFDVHMGWTKDTKKRVYKVKYLDLATRTPYPLKPSKYLNGIAEDGSVFIPPCNREDNKLELAFDIPYLIYMLYNIVLPQDPVTKILCPVTQRSYRDLEDSFEYIDNIKSYYNLALQTSLHTIEVVIYGIITSKNLIHYGLYPPIIKFYTLNLSHIIQLYQSFISPALMNPATLDIKYSNPALAGKVQLPSFDVALANFTTGAANNSTIHAIKTAIPNFQAAYKVLEPSIQKHIDSSLKNSRLYKGKKK